MTGVRLAVLVLAGVLASGATQGAGAQPAPAAPGQKPNVLFIAIDDLNDWVGHLGANSQSATPNLDRIARRGVRFTRAYAPVPVCNPSRAAVLSGMRPSTTGVYDNSIDWRPLIPEAKMITAQFRNAGYRVAAAGKVPHYLRESDWDVYIKSKDGFPRKKGDPLHGGPMVNDVTDDAMLDHRNVTWAVEKLQAPHDRPFFLAVGLTKPHLPWNVPRSYYERFPLESIELPPNLPTDLDDVPPEGIRLSRIPDHPGTDASDHETILREGRWKEGIQGYLAAIAFMDGQLGRLIDALDSSPHRDDTIVVLWSDNGFHLGEKLHWRKQTLWEESTRVPYTIAAPGVTRPGTVCDRPVDLMSLYPTLMDLAGLPIPGHVEGPSLRPLLADPKASWDGVALSTYQFRNHAVRTERWRYIRYADGGEELYDHEADPLEWKNLASDPKLASVKAELAKSLPTANVEDAPARPQSKAKANKKSAKTTKKAKLSHQ
jgi:arylsulfatase A-like enzyme